MPLLEAEFALKMLEKKLQEKIAALSDMALMDSQRNCTEKEVEKTQLLIQGIKEFAFVEDKNCNDI